MARYEKGSIVGNMKIVKQHMGKITAKGLVPYYDVLCCNCGRAHNMSHDSLRKRKNTGAIKCASCVQVGSKKKYVPHGKKYSVGYELNVPKELFDKFISSR